MTKSTKQAVDDLDSKYVDIYTSAFILDMVTTPENRASFISDNKLFNPLIDMSAAVVQKNGNSKISSRYTSRIKGEFVPTITPGVKVNVNNVLLNYTSFIFLNYLLEAKSFLPADLTLIYETGDRLVKDIQAFFRNNHPKCDYNCDINSMSFAKINCDPLLIEKIRANITVIRGVTINQIDEITSLTQQIIKAIYKYIGLINAVNFIKDNKSKLSRFNITAIYMGLQQQYNLFADDYYKQIISL